MFSASVNICICAGHVRDNHNIKTSTAPKKTELRKPAYSQELSQNEIGRQVGSLSVPGQDPKGSGWNCQTHKEMSEKLPMCTHKNNACFVRV